MDAWKVLPESEQSPYLALGDKTPQFNIPLTTSSGLINIDFIDLKRYTD